MWESSHLFVEVVGKVPDFLRAAEAKVLALFQ
jgi:hypothetical protein